MLAKVFYYLMPPVLVFDEKDKINSQVLILNNVSHFLSCLNTNY